MDKRRKSLNNITENKQIKTVFQPIISLRNGVLLGYEALSRIIGESEFENTETLFATAKQYNRLWDLELLSRTTALEAAKSFMIPPFKVKLFINVHPRIMHDKAFKKGFTKECLSKYSIDPSNIIFEITERNVINDMDGFKATIYHYKNQGYKIAIDDVGSGYSGLNLISAVNPNYVKLDMKLIRNINKDNLKGAIVKGMVEFSKVSNVKLIAEGIETYEELETLIELGVQYAQGYFIQKPAEKIHNIRPEVIQTIIEINRKLNQGDRSHNLSTIKYLSEPTKTISPEKPVYYAYDLIKQTPDCFGLCVVEDSVPVGIITKEKLSLMLSDEYGVGLNQNEPISVVMDRDFLAVESEFPVSVVSTLAMARTEDKLYDFIVVTEDGKYLGTVTIKTLLQKSTELEVSAAKQLNPLTGLPGNQMIEQKLNEYLESGKEYSVVYFDIENFKAYNDVYGFESGDLVIRLLADVLREKIPTNQFIGHIGGDDFLVILDSHKTQDDFKGIVELFESDVLAFYNQTDIENGYITAISRYGIEEKFPLVALTVVVVNNKSHEYESSYEISADLAGLKNKARRFRASAIPLNYSGKKIEIDT
ncbi:MAG: GGDEF domain-containing protein [Firmicutes bacterium]|nr:GGDEF domain-containing protein [Bacillota bacterium]